jgi:hypothetical protein
LTESQCKNWFSKFRSAHFDVEDAPVEANEDIIKALKG